MSTNGAFIFRPTATGKLGRDKTVYINSDCYPEHAALYLQYCLIGRGCPLENFLQVNTQVELLDQATIESLDVEYEYTISVVDQEIQISSKSVNTDEKFYFKSSLQKFVKKFATFKEQTIREPFVFHFNANMSGDDQEIVLVMEGEYYSKRMIAQVFWTPFKEHVDQRSYLKEFFNANEVYFHSPDRHLIAQQNFYLRKDPDSRLIYITAIQGGNIFDGLLADYINLLDPSIKVIGNRLEEDIWNHFWYLCDRAYRKALNGDISYGAGTMVDAGKLAKQLGFLELIQPSIDVIEQAFSDCFEKRNENYQQAQQLLPDIVGEQYALIRQVVPPRIITSNYSDVVPD